MFKSLGRGEIHKIIDLELFKLMKRIETLGYSLKLTEKAKDFIVDKGYDEKFGARPLKRALQKYIEDRLAEEIIKSNLQNGDTIRMDVNSTSDDLEIVISKSKSKDVTN